MPSVQLGAQSGRDFDLELPCMRVWDSNFSNLMRSARDMRTVNSNLHYGFERYGMVLYRKLKAVAEPWQWYIRIAS